MLVGLFISFNFLKYWYIQETKIVVDCCKKNIAVDYLDKNNIYNIDSNIWWLDFKKKY